jgi:acetyl esterase/lipase
VLNRRTPPPAPSVAYGAHPHHVANLHLPSRDGGPWPCVVLVHGGFWRKRWDRTLMTPLAHDVARCGLAAWNIEFRRVGQEGGGWPGTFEDVAAAIDHLADVEEIDEARVATCGHSAGGHLSLWLAGRHRLTGGVGASPRVRPVAAVSQAGVCDLERAWRDDLGDGAVEDLLGPLSEGSDRLPAASPSALVPLGVPQLLVHGVEDDVVPVAQSRDYATREPSAELLELEGLDHFDVVDVEHPAWAVTRDWLSTRLGA